MSDPNPYAPRFYSDPFATHPTSSYAAPASSSASSFPSYPSAAPPSDATHVAPAPLLDPRSLPQSFPGSPSSKSDNRGSTHSPRFCSECGAPLPPHTKFCPGCGAATLVGILPTLIPANSSASSSPSYSATSPVNFQGPPPQPAPPAHSFASNAPPYSGAQPVNYQAPPSQPTPVPGSFVPYGGFPAPHPPFLQPMGLMPPIPDHIRIPIATPPIPVHTAAPMVTYLAPNVMNPPSVPLVHRGRLRTVGVCSRRALCVLVSARANTFLFRL